MGRKDSVEARIHNRGVWTIDNFRRPAARELSGGVEFSLSFDFDAIELDVRVSKDGVPVLMHDDTIDKTSNGKGSVDHYTLRELQQFSLGKWQGEDVRIPTLEAALDAADPRLVIVDWRAPGHEAALRRASRGHEIIISAHSVEQALVAKREVPEARVFLKTYDAIADLDVTDAKGLDGWMVDARNGVDGQFLEQVHREGLDLITFVHDHRMSRWHLWKQQWQGVDYILTTRSAWARQYPFD